MTTLPACDEWPHSAREAHRRLLAAAFGWEPSLLFLDADGRPLIGGYVYVFENGTTIPATTYCEYRLLVANTHPVITDSQGRAAIFFARNKKYDVVVHDANGMVVGPYMCVVT